MHTGIAVVSPTGRGICSETDAGASSGDEKSKKNKSKDVGPNDLLFTISGENVVITNDELQKPCVENAQTEEQLPVFTGDHLTVEYSGNLAGSRGKTNTKNTVYFESGINQRATHSMKTQLVWPQTLLKYGHTSEDLDYWQLDLPLLVAGELSVIGAGHISKEEEVGRMELLKATAYHAQTYV